MKAKEVCVCKEMSRLLWYVTLIYQIEKFLNVGIGRGYVLFN